MAARTAEEEARAAAKARKTELQRADAEAVWKQVRKEEQTLLDRTAKLRELRLAREAEARNVEQAPAERKAKTRAKRARVGSGN